MIKTLLFQLHDTTAGQVAGPIMSMKKEGPAIREFHAVLGMKDTQPGRYPEQFNLILVGEQDEETGAITSCTPTIVATGAAWANQQESPSAVQLKIS